VRVTTGAFDKHRVVPLCSRRCPICSHRVCAAASWVSAKVYGRIDPVTNFIRALAKCMLARDDLDELRHLIKEGGTLNLQEREEMKEAMSLRDFLHLRQECKFATEQRDLHFLEEVTKEAIEKKMEGDITVMMAVETLSQLVAERDYKFNHPAYKFMRKHDIDEASASKYLGFFAQTGYVPQNPSESSPHTCVNEGGGGVSKGHSGRSVCVPGERRFCELVALRALISPGRSQLMHTDLETRPALLPSTLSRMLNYSRSLCLVHAVWAINARSHDSSLALPSHRPYLYVLTLTFALLAGTIAWLALRV